MRVIGIDPGSHNMGWGVIESHGSKLTVVASGTVSAPPGALAMRLRVIADALDALLAEYRPVAASIESVFHAKNSQSAIKLGHARGVVLLCAERAGAEIHEYAPALIKKAVTSNGRAAKTQVQTMVMRLLGHRGEMGLDESDALAAAICHAHLAPSMRAMERAKASADEATRQNREHQSGGPQSAGPHGSVS